MGSRKSEASNRFECLGVQSNIIVWHKDRTPRQNDYTSCTIGSRCFLEFKKNEQDFLHLMTSCNGLSFCPYVAIKSMEKI